MKLGFKCKATSFCATILVLQLFNVEEASATVLRRKNCKTHEGGPGTCTSLDICNYMHNIVSDLDKPKYTICEATFFEIFVCCPDEMDRPDARGTNLVEVDEEPHSNEFLQPPQCGISNALHNRIVGGDEADLGAWPWIGLLGIRLTKDSKDDIFECGASLISSRHIVTAAHCAEYEDVTYIVRLGEHDQASSKDGAHPIDVLVDKVHVHPNYNTLTKVNDIAIMKLKDEVKFTEFIHPICLPTTDDLQNRNLTGYYPFVAGWGSLSYQGPASSVLREVQVPIVSNDRCKEAFMKKKVKIDDRVICAGYDDGGKDACQGDSGGPLMLPVEMTYYLIGVVSNGYRCAKANFPGVYTRITSFLDFIKSNMD